MFHKKNVFTPQLIVSFEATSCYTVYLVAMEDVPFGIRRGQSHDDGTDDNPLHTCHIEQWHRWKRKLICDVPIRAGMTALTISLDPDATHYYRSLNWYTFC